MKNSKFNKAYFVYFIKYYILTMFFLTFNGLRYTPRISFNPFDFVLAFFISSFIGFNSAAKYSNDGNKESIIFKVRRIFKENYIISDERLYNWSLICFILITYIGSATTISSKHIEYGRFIFIFIPLMARLIKSSSNYRINRKTKYLADMLISFGLMILIVYITFMI